MASKDAPEGERERGAEKGRWVHWWASESMKFCGSICGSGEENLRSLAAILSGGKERRERGVRGSYRRLWVAILALQQAREVGEVGVMRVGSSG
jgi:hypothetical protein